MDLILGLDISLALLGFVLMALPAWRCLRRRRRPGLGAAVVFVVGVVLLAEATIDVGLPKSDQPAIDWGFGDGVPPYAKRLSAGEPAPDFSLPSANDGRSVRLSDFRDRKPVLLFFSSFT